MATLTYAGSPANIGARSAFGKLPQGGVRFAVVRLAITGTYAAGGDTLDPQKFGMGRIIAVFGQYSPATDAGDDVLDIQFVPATVSTPAKIKVFRTVTAGTVAAANETLDYDEFPAGAITATFDLFVIGV